MEKLGLAKMMAQMKGIDFQHRDLVDKWILLTYDLPVTPEGNKIRSDFLKSAPKMGAVMQNRSVYLMPLTNETQVAALNLSKAYGGSVYCWTSEMMDEEINRNLTELYDMRVGEVVTTIRTRINKIKQHIKDEKFRFAKMMVKKTIALFNNAMYSTAQRGNKETFHTLEKLYNELAEIQVELYNKE